MLDSLWHNSCADNLCREVFIGLPRFMHTGFYILAGAMIAVFFIASYMKIQIWLTGRDEDDTPELQGITPLGVIVLSIRKLLSPECLLAYRVKTQNIIRQWALIITMWSFYVLVIGTAMVALDYDFFYGAVLQGMVWQVFSLILDIAGLALMAGVAFFLLRRYVFPPERIVANFEDAMIMILLLLVAVSAFFVEGTRLAVQGFPPHWSPVGMLFGRAVEAVMFGNLTLMQLFYPLTWVIHVGLSFAFILYIPFSKQFHMFATQITTANVENRKRYRAGLMYQD